MMTDRASLVSRLSHHPLFNRLQYTKTGLVHLIT